MKTGTAISVIIPVYNEKKIIESCLESLAKQTFRDFEIILIDDGSTDQTPQIIHNQQEKHTDLKLAVLHQDHGGTGMARNLGAKQAKGEILVFVDADMEFSPEFLETLTEPIVRGVAIGTYSTEEKLLNRDNVWAKCWNINLVGSTQSLSENQQRSLWENVYLKFKTFLETVEQKMSPVSPVSITRLGRGGNAVPFRAILKEKFLSVGGFDVKAGYSDDWTIAEKLQVAPVITKALFYHRNPANLGEIWKQARWIGKDRFKSGNIVRIVHSLLKYNPLTSVIVGIYKSLKYRLWEFVPFEMVFYTGIMVSVLQMLISKSRAR